MNIQIRPPLKVISRPRPEIAFPDLASFPPIYGMKLVGDCLEPDLPDGSEVVFERDAPIAPGDFCIFVLEPEHVSTGGMQSLIKRLVLAPPSFVTFPWTENPKSDVHALVVAEQLKPHRQYMIKCDRLLAIHKFVRVQNGGAQ